VRKRRTSPAGLSAQARDILSSTFAADRVEDQLDTAATGDFAGPRLEILGTVVDEMIDA
jgi:hypothetical protein